MRRFLLSFIVWPFCLALSLNGSIQADERYSDGMVRAAVIFGILRFTDWPESREPKAVLQICSSGSSPAIEAIRNLKELPSIGATTVNYRANTTGKDVNDCHVLLIGKDGNSIKPDWAHGLLLICDECAVDFAQGWMINLTRNDNRIQFEVNMDRVLERKITLGASLLELAARCSSEQKQIRGCDD